MEVGREREREGLVNVERISILILGLLCNVK